MVDTSFFINNGPFTLQQVADICEAELQNAEKAGVTVNNINTMEKAGAGEICFFYDKKAKAKGAEIKAEACVTTAELAQFVAENVIVLISANPKLAFLKLNSRLYAEYQPRADIASSARIHPSAIIGQNCSIADHVVIGENVKIGPFARLRPEAVLSDDVHVGNFVEIKKSFIGKSSKINHLSYIGDTQMGERVNIGAGTITCNYDGVHKSKTVIGDDAFIGSDTQLIAPVTVGAGATLGAGTTLAKDAPAGKLTISRMRQMTIENWTRPQKTDK